eukprot:gene20769-21474_t
MAQVSLPALASLEGGLSRYLDEIRKFPMLEPQEEYMLAKRFHEHQDPKAAERLVTSHLRLVAKIAMGYRGYGLPIGEVISEGNVGLMHAVKRFEPEKGFRLATYAMWWIKASIQEYILRSWSLVKMGTTANQKRLFFNLRRMKSQIQALDEGDLKPDQVKTIATKLGVTEAEVNSMNRRLGGDASLNAPLRSDEESSEWQDWLVDDSENVETRLGDEQELQGRRKLLQDALGVLNERERRIFEARRLVDDPMTLEDLSDEFGVSRERVRQIEVRAFEKVQDAVKAAALAVARSQTRMSPAPAPSHPPSARITSGRIFVSLGALMMAAGVGMAAAAAHAGAGRELGSAALLLLSHAPMLAAVGLAIATGHVPPRIGSLGAGVALLGCALFSADMASRAFAGGPLLPLVAPIGGSAAIAGWTS